MIKSKKPNSQIEICEDVYLTILSHLTLNELHSSILVCRSWNSIVHEILSKSSIQLLKYNIEEKIKTTSNNKKKNNLRNNCIFHVLVLLIITFISTHFWIAIILLFIDYEDNWRLSIIFASIFLFTSYCFGFLMTRKMNYC